MHRFEIFRVLPLVALTVIAACELSIEIEESPTDIVAADLDGDGQVDLAMSAIQLYGGASPRPGKVLVTLQRPSMPGSFLPLTEHRVANGARYIAAGDLDGDGRVDLAVSTRDEARVAVLRQDPLQPGRFLTAEHWPVGEHPLELAIGDFDGDGLNDLAVEAIDGDVRRVFLLFQDRRRPGDFSDLRVVDEPQSVSGVASADFDGDGHDDLAVSVTADPQLPGTLEILLQDPTVPASFVRVGGYQVGFAPGRLRTADLDGDGQTDLMVVNTGLCDQPGTTGLSVLLQRTGTPGVFEPSVELLVGEPVEAVAEGDLDGDDRGDLAVALGNRVALLRQDPAARGSFQESAILGTETYVSEVSLADFDGDGLCDIAVDDRETAAIYYQHAGSPGAFRLPVRVGR